MRLIALSKKTAAIQRATLIRVGLGAIAVDVVVDDSRSNSNPNSSASRCRTTNSHRYAKEKTAFR